MAEEYGIWFETYPEPFAPTEITSPADDQVFSDGPTEEDCPIGEIIKSIKQQRARCDAADINRSESLGGKQ